MESRRDWIPWDARCKAHRFLIPALLRRAVFVLIHGHIVTLWLLDSFAFAFVVGDCFARDC
jgi:hypothetical protein